MRPRCRTGIHAHVYMRTHTGARTHTRTHSHLNARAPTRAHSTRTRAQCSAVQRRRRRRRPAGTLTNDVVKLKSTLDTTHMHHKSVASEVRGPPREHSSALHIAALACVVCLVHAAHDCFLRVNEAFLSAPPPLRYISESVLALAVVSVVCVCVCWLFARDVDPCGLRTTCDTDTAQVKDHIVTLHSTIQQSSSTFGFWTYFAFFQVSAPHQPSAAHRCAR